MEEKKSKGISASGFFLIIAIIVIAAMGYFVYKFYNDKTNETKRADELQAQVDRLNGAVSELQGRINTISETINTSKISENEDITNSKYEQLTDSIKNDKASIQNDYEDIILNGNYMQGEAGDEVWSFSEDNKVSHSLVISNFRGTYKTIDKNMIEAHFTEEERDDLNNPPQKDIYAVDEYYKISIIDNNTIKIVDTNQELHKAN